MRDQSAGSVMRIPCSTIRQPEYLGSVGLTACCFHVGVGMCIPVGYDGGVSRLSITSLLELVSESPSERSSLLTTLSEHGPWASKLLHSEVERLIRLFMSRILSPAGIRKMVIHGRRRGVFACCDYDASGQWRRASPGPPYCTVGEHMNVGRSGFSSNASSSYGIPIFAFDENRMAS